MKTSRRKYNTHYRRQHLYIDGFHAPKIVPTCNEHVRCEECGSHVKLSGKINLVGGYGADVYECPTCGKAYGVAYSLFDEDDKEAEE